MRKSLVLLVGIVCALVAHATTYNYLVFTSANGTSTAFDVSDLTLSVSGSELEVSNAEGTVHLVLTDLVSMEFSEDGLPSTGLENVLDAKTAVQVFSLSGVRLGSFSSLLDAAGSLSAGVYILSNGSVTQKIVVK